jgi:hypothetical protein
MATYVPAKRATEYVFYIGLTSQSTGQFQANPTIAAGDFKVSKDGGALANLTTLPAVTPAASKMVKITLSDTEMTADNVTVVASDAAGAEWDDVIINIQTAARQIDDLLPTASYTAPDNATITSIQVDTNDIQSRLPAALTAGGNIKADVLAISGDATAADNEEAFFDGTGYAGTNNVIPTVTTATNVTTVNGLAANVITAASMAADASAEIADTVWDEDATAHQTQGTFGQAIGDPGGDTTTIYSAVVTDAAGDSISADIATLQFDMSNIQSRLPATLSASGLIKADLKSIDGELTTGNNATLNLKKLNIVNSAGTAFVTRSSGGDGDGISIEGQGAGTGIRVRGGGTGIDVLAGATDGYGMAIESQASNFPGLFIQGVDGVGAVIEGAQEG